MNALLSLVEVLGLGLYLIALLHASQGGARPRVEVIYRLNDVDNVNELLCYDGVSNLTRSGATYTFRNPMNMQIEETFMVPGDSYPFIIHPTNESIISCTIDSKESDPVMVAGILTTVQLLNRSSVLLLCLRSCSYPSVYCWYNSYQTVRLFRQ